MVGCIPAMAVSICGNASRDAAVHTQRSSPHNLSVSPGPSSVLFSLKTPPISGGTPITSFVLQWRQSAAEQWKEITVPASELLVISSLKPYILYTVHLAALNAVGLGPFSHTQAAFAHREYDVRDDGVERRAEGHKEGPCIGPWGVEVLQGVMQCHVHCIVH